MLSLKLHDWHCCTRRKANIIKRCYSVWKHLWSVGIANWRGVQTGIHLHWTIQAANIYPCAYVCIHTHVRLCQCVWVHNHAHTHTAELWKSPCFKIKPIRERERERAVWIEDQSLLHSSCKWTAYLWVSNQQHTGKLQHWSHGVKYVLLCCSKHCWDARATLGSCILNHMTCHNS